MCNECREWRCVCELKRYFEENREQYREALLEHRLFCARRDPAFQKFIKGFAL